jgi:hypothetical protein
LVQHGLGKQLDLAESFKQVDDIELLEKLGFTSSEEEVFSKMGAGATEKEAGEEVREQVTPGVVEKHAVDEVLEDEV